jgi:hypothetical protein
MKPSESVFRVKRALKGTIANIVTIRDTGNGCYGLPQFTEKKEYLVFAVGKEGRYETYHPLPNGSADAENARAFIESLGKLSPAKPR